MNKVIQCLIATAEIDYQKTVVIFQFFIVVVVENGFGKLDHVDGFLLVIKNERR